MSSSKPISISLGSRKSAIDKAASSQANNAKSSTQSRASRKSLKLGGEADFDDDSAPQHEELIGFDNTGAITTTTSSMKGPLIIKTEKGNAWRDRLKAQRGQKQQQAVVNPNDSKEIDAPSTKGGLSFATKSEVEIQTEDNKDAKDDDVRMKEVNTIDREDHQQKRLNEDEIAIRALADTEGGHGNKNLVIQTRTSNDDDQAAVNQQNEVRNFRDDVASRPEPATLADYDSVPVEDFGAALLRGMGWKDGQTLKSKYGSTPGGGKPPTAERRPALLGIGAKGLATKEEDTELRLGFKRRRKAEEKKVEPEKDNRKSDRHHSREKYRDREDRHPDRYRDRDRHSDRETYRSSGRERDQNGDKYRGQSEDRAREHDRDRRCRERSREKRRYHEREDKYSYRERDRNRNGHRHRHKHDRSPDRNRDR